MPLKVREMIALLERDGWYLAKQTGGHRQFKHPTKIGRVTVPGGLGKELPLGTERSISQASGVEEKIMSHPYRYLIVIERADDGGYGAWAPDLPGCVALGDTVEETERSMREAIAFHLEGMREDGQPIPEPSKVAAALIVEVDAA